MGTSGDGRASAPSRLEAAARLLGARELRLRARELGGAKLLALLDLEPSALPGAADVALWLAIPRTSFSRGFRRAFGCSWDGFRRATRIAEARRILRRWPRAPIRFVARRVGYRSVTAFYRAYRASEHRTPRGVSRPAPRAPGMAVHGARTANTPVHGRRVVEAARNRAWSIPCGIEGNAWDSRRHVGTSAVRGDRDPA
jgi:AraC-like DNA-binding protein